MKMDEFTVGETISGHVRTPHDRLGPRTRATGRTGAQLPPPPAPPPPRPDTPHDDREEVDAVATWFARIGALALVVAAAYGYKYAVDRGLVSPAMRVVMGMVAGVVLLAAGEATRRRTWTAFAQAVTGGGIGFLYLSTWAAYERYGLIEGPTAFGALTLIIGIGIALAWRHESEALTIISTAAGFLNPYLVGDVMAPIPALAYVALLDVGILAIVAARPWRVVGRVAFIGTWAFAVLSADAAGPGWALAYGAVFWALFSAHSLVQVARDRTADPEEGGFAVVNGFVFLFFGLAVLIDHAPQMRGAFTAALGAGYLVQWATMRARAPQERVLATGLLAMAVGFFTLSVPLQFRGHEIMAAWTVQSVILVALGRAQESRAMRLTGVALLGTAVAGAVLFLFGLGSTYEPPAPLLSSESFTLLLQVAALHTVAWLNRSSATEAAEGELERTLPMVASLAGHGLALLWAAFETGAYWYSHRTGIAAESAVQFTFTVTWSVYAAVMMTAGIATRRRRARIAALGLLVVTISKVALIDLWLLTTLERVLAFGALGVILLMCSLMYHRFRELILEADGR